VRLLALCSRIVDLFRAVVRDIKKGHFWESQGCEIACAEMQDPASLTAAFTGTDGVFILPPSEFDPAPGFPEARAVIAAVKAALESACPNKVVCLSTIGAQSTKSNLLTQRTLMEQASVNYRCQSHSFAPDGSWRT
jgi:NAD(P)H dehydrogenase (quinone)